MTVRLEQIATATDSPAVSDVVQPARLRQVELHGVRIHAVTEKQAIDYVLDALDRGQGGMVVTPNLDHLRRSRSDLGFGALLAEAELVVADGMPLIWASRLRGTALPGRVAGSDLISSLSEGAAGRGRSIFLLGGEAGTAAAAGAILRQRYPNLTVAGSHCPPAGFEAIPDEMGAIIEKLQDLQPDIVYVALGSPKQERLIAQLRVTCPKAWWLGVGVSFSFLTGDVRRAPAWMRRTGLEWVHRLAQEPRRLFKRYILVGLPFAAKLLATSAAQGIWARLSTSGAREETATQTPPTVLVTPPSLPISPAPLPRVTHIEGTGLSRLKGIVLLAGAVRQTPLRMNIGRSVLDLPVSSSSTIFTRWLDEAARLAQSLGLEKLPVRVLLPSNMLEPVRVDAGMAGRYTIERDLSEYRGTGGILSNLAGDYEDNDLILVANAAQILLTPLPEICGDLGKTGGVVSLVSHQDGTPSGLMLLAGGALRLIPRQGFVDMKEQALPAIAAVHDVGVVQKRRPTGLPVRTLSDYVSALRQLHLPEADGALASDEDWRPGFNIAEAGAEVDGSARVHDSVVLAGGIVEPGAVVVRSVVCDGGIVKRDRKSVDQIVSLARVNGNGRKVKV